MIVMASHMQEQEVGDGTNFVLVFAGALLELAEELLRIGLSVSEASVHFSVLVSMCVLTYVHVCAHVCACVVVCAHVCTPPLLPRAILRAPASVSLPSASAADRLCRPRLVHTRVCL